MDSVTQAALGAAIGQAGFRKLGRRAIAYGAVCGTLPDLDSLFSAGDRWANMVTHRGISHSFVVLPVVAVLLGWLAWRFLGKKGTPKDWMLLTFLGLITHPMLDFCTTYGTQIFAPLSSYRYSCDAVAIIDLIYTLPLLVALAYGVRKKADVERSVRWARNGLVWGVTYLVVSFGISQWTVSTFEDKLVSEGFEVEAARVSVPVLFPMLRHGVARDAQGRIAVAKLRVWDTESAEIVYVDSLQTDRVKTALASERGQRLLWFSDGFLSVREGPNDALDFQDHRYGFFTKPKQSFFGAWLPAENEPDDLVLSRPGQRRRSINMAKEVSAGWAVVWDSEEEKL